jgi:transcriptional regulator with XRE-family HTH domain
MAQDRGRNPMMEAPRETFGGRLERLHASRNIPQAEIARRCGFSAERYGNYVRGTREPDFATLLTICRELRTTPNFLLGYEPAEENKKCEELISLYDQVPKEKQQEFLKFVGQIVRLLANTQLTRRSDIAELHELEDFLRTLPPDSRRTSATKALRAALAMVEEGGGVNLCDTKKHSQT